MRSTREWLLLVLFLAIAGGFLSLILGSIDKAKLAVREAHSVESEYQALEERRSNIASSLAALSTERGRDAALRTSFGVARPGEEVIVVVPPATTAPTSTPSWWEQFTGWFR